MKKPKQIEVQYAPVKLATSNQPTDHSDEIIDPTKNELSSRFKSSVERANPISRLYFLYPLPTLIKGFKADKEKKLISSKDMMSFPWNLRADTLSARFEHRMEKQKREKPKKKTSLTRAIFWTVKWPFIWLVIMQTMFLFTRIFSTWVLKRLVDHYVSTNENHDDKWKWAGGLSACLILAFHLEHHYNHIATYLPNHIQNALINVIYEKLLKLSTDSLNKISSGRIINLCTNGVNLFEQLGLFTSNIIVGPIALVAGGAIIWQSFGVFTLIPLGYIVFWYPLQEFFIIWSLKERERTNRATANRIRLTNETIEAIRLLKMYTWEMKFKEKIAALRKVEVKMLKNSAITAATIRGISFSTQVVTSFLLFMPYHLCGGVLTPGSIFAAYFVLGYLRQHSSFYFGLAMNFLTDARLLIKNIEGLLDAPETGDFVFEDPRDTNNVAEFENFTAFWDSSDKQQSEKPIVDKKDGYEKKLTILEVRPVLTDINLHIKKGSLNALVGAVGSGKTSFLMSFTGEMPKTTGSLRCKGSISYVEQDPTIFAGTFRENVTFGRPYEPEFYDRVVKACNLDNDLKLFADGDLSVIGERGNNLSGGQKARLALARAVYSQADINLLDDPLSAVDPKVARSIYNNAITDVLKGKTVLLTTHQVDFARSCENIILMEKGKVLGSGTYEELKEQGIDVDKVFGNSQTKRDEELKAEDFKAVEAKTAQDDKEDKDNQEGADDKQVKKDQYSVSVTWRTYYGLLKEMGGSKFCMLLIIIYVTGEMATIGYGRMLGAWIARDFEDWISLTALGSIVAFDIIIFIVKYQYLGQALIHAAESYHQKMLNRVMNATVFFFDTNPVGQIINRFSSDIGILDKFIPLAMQDLTNLTFVLGSTIITVGIINPIILGPYVMVIFVCIFIIKFVFPAVKQAKLYELRSKGPLFGLLSATLSGLVIIRVYRQSASFQKRFKDFLHTTVRANYNFNVTGRVMSFYCDMVYNIAAIVCIFIITAKAQKGDISASGLAAFALALVLGITGILQYGLRQFNQMNISMAAVGRVQAYLGVPLEPPLDLPGDKKKKAENWPQKGEIDFNKVYMKYRPDGDHVIRDLSLHVEQGQKIGCVGRTGAGKSTIIQLLYRMQEIDRQGDAPKERSIKMDDVDIQSVGLNLLRNNISIIPQSPFIFTGSIRLNVDPLGQFSDEEIWTALEDVRLREHVELQPRKLGTEIHGVSAVFSAGQKQLVCLARAILKHSNVLIMDEATANMDYDTDNFVQKKIAQRFAHATQFTIAHRLQTIASYDKVLVLDRGRRVEFDEPYKLLVKNIGDTELTNTEGHFSIMVQNAGPISSKKIFEIAREAYFEKDKVRNEENRKMYKDKKA